ncbi:MAG: glutathione peroxidase [Flavobacteriales bacterium]|nr:glutathione peroxidase [Flavobacteriales bacterium]
MNNYTSIYDFKLLALNGKDTINLGDFKGKYMLFVNVASKCGYTPQYEGLQALYEARKDSLIIVGLPCNQFGLQEPGNSAEIDSFCRLNYGVTFPLTEKVDVKGENQHPLYKWLTNKDFNGLDNFEVDWNFNKFLVAPDGRLLARFSSKVQPESEEIANYLK